METSFRMSSSKKDITDINQLLSFISKQNFYHPLINYACKELGIPNEQLIPKTLLQIQDKNTSKEVNELRFQHFEARRKAKLNIIAEYLLENKLFVTYSSKSVNKVTLTPSPSKTPRKYTENTPSASVTQEINTERKAVNIKNRIIKRLTVNENLKKIQQDKEEARKIVEQKIKDKEKREKNILINTKQFEVRDQRIKERLEKKQSDIEKHEKSVLNSFQKTEYENESKYQYQAYTPPHRYVEVIFI